MIILVVAILLVVCVKVGADFLTKRTLKKVKINEVPISQVADGEYVGEAQIKPVSAKVNVQVENEKITDIEIKDHMTGLGKNGEKIIDQIINKQSLDVDAISGATQSSVTITKAVENALTQEN
ncbi:FMN-binding protein [Enterococcus sp. T0101B.F-10]|uniref:FMN-binding protein n=1 Tax=Enterococcus sp. T0101B.F-10 TaxID=2315837 RepID=UPI0011E65B9F|nr:FMN-binding protein [Enterococcus sp. T0101B.F-10]TXV45734.1 FMN-binding protein [Enterococcus sp. T0101B.F-10]